MWYKYSQSNYSIKFPSIPEWMGEDLNSKKILVYNDQGIGDAIQFSKYLINDVLYKQFKISNASLNIGCRCFCVLFSMKKCALHAFVSLNFTECLNEV